MEQHPDRIYDLYYGKAQEEKQKETRDRLHWIVSRVKGGTILDVGCSQGMLPILLGREGKQATGLDASAHAIDTANANLEKEEPKTRACITYKHENLFHYTCTTSYDTVILGHVLEEIIDVSTFFTRAAACVKEGGHIIVTAPLGQTGSREQKQTFYMADILSLQTDSISLEDIHYSSRWIGAVFAKKENGAEQKHIQDDLLGQLESAVRMKEEYLMDEHIKLKKQIDILQEKLDTSEERNEEQESIIEEQKTLKQAFLEEKNSKVNVQKELYDTFDKQEKLIKDYRNLSKKHEMTLKRYHKLRNYKLGKLTIKYWKLRRRKRSK